MGKKRDIFPFTFSPLPFPLSIDRRSWADSGSDLQTTCTTRMCSCAAVRRTALANVSSFFYFYTTQMCLFRHLQPRNDNASLFASDRIGNLHLAFRSPGPFLFGQAERFYYTCLTLEKSSIKSFNERSSRKKPRLAPFGLSPCYPRFGRVSYLVQAQDGRLRRSMYFVTCTSSQAKIEALPSWGLLI